MRLHPGLKDLLGLDSEYIDEQSVYKLEKCCPNCHSDIMVAPEALACEGNNCLWQAGANYDLVSTAHWIWEPGEQVIAIYVSYDSYFTSIQIGEKTHIIYKTLTLKELEEIYELLLWM